MIRTYFKTFFRSLGKHRTFSIINLLGLSTGLATSLLMALYVHHELTYDEHFVDSDRLFRIIQRHTSENDRSTAGNQFPAAPLILQDYPDVEAITRIHPLLPRVGSFETKTFMESGFVLADPSFFEVFKMEAIQGSLEDALSRPTDLVMNSTTAAKYFGEDWESQDIVGKTFRVKNSVDYQIAAVVPDLPNNTHFKFNLLLPFGKVYGNFITNNWNFSRFYTYVKLKESSDVKAFESNLSDFTRRYFPNEKKASFVLEPQAVRSIHLESKLSGELSANSNMRQVILFGMIGVLILAIASINFTNLMTAMGSRRHKEIGIKKVLGAKKKSLICQYLTETVLLSGLAGLLAIGLVDLTIAWFSEVTGVVLSMDTMAQPLWVAAILGTVLLVGIISGLYPAYYLTSLKAVRALTNRSDKGSANTGLRKVLVTTQFTITTCLIVAVLTIFQQLNYLRSKDLGFNKDAVVMLRSHPKVNTSFAAFKNELERHSSIRNVGFTYGNLLGGGSFAVRARLDQNGGDETTAVPFLYADYDLASTMGLTVKEGRWFSKEFVTDTTQAFVINETAAKTFGWEGEALGKEISYFGGGTNSIEKQGRVVGVVKDFFHESLHENLEPLMITLSHTYVPTFPNCYIPIKIQSADVKSSLAHIEDTWNAHETGVPIELNFLDDSLNQLYEKDQKLGNIINASAILALLIASIGVFGLASFTVYLRVKEIGIRKVLGANIGEVLIMMINSFLKPVMVAFLLALPISIYLMNKWLEGFAYRTELGLKTFLITAIISVFIALLAVFGQSYKAARTNPVNVLRND